MLIENQLLFDIKVTYSKHLSLVKHVLRIYYCVLVILLDRQIQDQAKPITVRINSSTFVEIKDVRELFPY